MKQAEIRKSYQQLEFDVINKLQRAETFSERKKELKRQLRGAFIDGYLAAYYLLGYDDPIAIPEEVVERVISVSITGKSVDDYIDEVERKQKEDESSPPSDNKDVPKGEDQTIISIDRIGRTETHRVFVEGQKYGCEEIERRKGTLIYKRWDATLDEKTRPTHFALNGTIKPIDEYFETYNGKALQPGGFGIADEDCNCRCILSFTEYGRS